MAYDDSTENLKFLGVSSQALAGQGGDGWMDEIATHPGWEDTCPPERTSLRIDGASGVLVVHCPNDTLLTALVTTEDRGYMITLYGVGDRDMFDEILSTVDLRPEDAWVRPALTETFASARHGISIGYPAGWMFQPATEPWPVGGAVQQSAPYVDVIYQQENDSPFIAVASQPLGGRTGDEWASDLAAYIPDVPAECRETEPVTVDLARGSVSVECNVALVSTEDRGYLIWLYRISDQGWFEQILATVQLDPASAIDTP